jgi:hypothetical protein
MRKNAGYARYVKNVKDFMPAKGGLESDDFGDLN